MDDGRWLLVRNRRKFKIGLFSITFFSFLFLILHVTTFASNEKQRIYDLAGLLTAEEIETLEAMSNKYSKRRKTDIVILTTNDTQGRDVVEYMEDFYDEQALGYDRPHGNTAILTIDMQHREVYVAGFYRGEEYLDNSRCDLIRYKITPNLSKGNYYEAFRSFIKTSYQYMGIRPGVNPDAMIFNLWFQLIISLGVASIVVAIMSYHSGGKITVSEGTYLDPSNSRIIQQRDDYVRSSVTKHKKPSNNSPGGGSKGGGGGGGGVSRGGHSHSGSRGSF